MNSIVTYKDSSNERLAIESATVPLKLLELKFLFTIKRQVGNSSKNSLRMRMQLAFIPVNQKDLQRNNPRK